MAKQRDIVGEYDRIVAYFRRDKGGADIVRQRSQELGFDSASAYLRYLVLKDIREDKNSKLSSDKK